MSEFGNQKTFRPGQADYSALAQEGLDDLMPPDIRAAFSEAGREVTGSFDDPDAERALARDGGKDGGGAAVFDGAPKPVPGDELAAAAYQRPVDARTDAGLMAAVGIGAASARAQEGDEIALPQPTQGASPQPTEAERGNYAALRQQHTEATNPPELSDLMPPEARAEAQQGFSGAAQETGDRAQEQPKGELDDLMPPDIRADVERTNYQQSRQRGASLGL